MHGILQSLFPGTVYMAMSCKSTKIIAVKYRQLLKNDHGTHCVPADARRMMLSSV